MAVEDQSKRVHVYVGNDAYSVFRLGAVLHGLSLKDYMNTVVRRWAVASNDVLMQQPLRRLHSPTSSPTSKTPSDNL